MADNFVTSTLDAPDTPFDISLRPPMFSEFAGQEKVCERLEVMVQAAQQRGDVLDHILLSGPPGLGKTTLAYILANAMGVAIKSTSGPTIEKAGDLAGLLTTLERGDVLFIDEIHRLQPAIEEYLYPAMEDFKLDIIIDQGPNARSVRLNLPKFTLIGATTRSGMISSPLRSRFGMSSRLDYYVADELQKILQRSARILNIDIDAAGALEIAARSRGTPRIANNLLRWVRDFAQVRADSAITRDVADRALAMLEEVGINDAAKRIHLYPHEFSGGMRQRVMIAMALITKPELLIADEPTTALDVTVQAQILELIKKMQRELGMAVIFITHDLGVVSGLCDSVQVMYAGRIVETADTRTLFYSPKHPYTRALQRSIPSMQGKGTELFTIPGMPPDLSKPIAGCAFAPRCEFVTERCQVESPELAPVSATHDQACLRVQAGEL